MLPSQISWHLAWSDLFSLFQSLHTAISAKDTLEQVIFLGENQIICQNLQQVWQQFFEEIAYDCGLMTETDLIPTIHQILTQSSYSNETNLQNFLEPTVCKLVIQQINDPFMIKPVEAGMLMVTKNYTLWLQIQPLPITSWQEQPTNHTTTSRVANDLDLDYHSDWQVTVVLDQQVISHLLQDSRWTGSTAALNQRVSSKQEQASIHQFWRAFHSLTRESFPLSLGAVPLAQSRSEAVLLASMLQQMPLGMFQLHLDGSFLEANAAFCQLTGYTWANLSQLDLKAITQPEDFLHELDMIQQIVLYEEQRIFEKRFNCQDGKVIWAEVKLSLVGSPDDENSFLLGFVTDLSGLRQVEAEHLQAMQEIQKRQEREILLNNIASRIRSAIDLPTMLQNAVTELNQALGSDRVVVYQIFDDQSGCCVSEAVNPKFPAMHGQNFKAECIPPPYLDAYRAGRVWSVDNVPSAYLADCHQTMLQQVQVKSMVATGILSMDEFLEPNKRKLWGLLVVHQCRSPRQWTKDELHLVEAVANQLAIALEQTKLLNQLTTYTQELESRVNQRTQSLERSLKFEQFIRSLAECLHRDFNEGQLLNTVVQGLVPVLKADICLVCIYDAQTDAFQVQFEALSNTAPNALSLLNQHVSWRDLPSSLQERLNHRQTSWSNGLLKDTCWLKWLLPPQHPWVSLDATPLSEMGCPIIDTEGCVGLLLVVQFGIRQFDAAESELIEQTTDYCSIALRQASLYRQEHEQRLSAEYLRSFLEKSTDVYVEYDTHLRYISINPAGCTLLGRSLTEIIGKTNQELFESDSQYLDQLIQQAFDTAEQVFVDHEILLPEGKHVFESVYAPITDPSGKVQRVLGVSRDISEFKHQWQILEQQNQQLAETTRIKEEFVATTSHELRTPLTAILGFSNVLLQEFFGELNSKQKDYIERIYNSGQHLLELINDILDLSRLEAGRMELDLQAIYVPEICETVTDLIQERAINQGLQLELDIDLKIEWIVADPRRLKQMLLNLLANAVKFTPQGTVGLKVYCDSAMPLVGNLHSLMLSGSTTDGSKNQQFIHFLVWDTGIGIDEADQRSLFSPFSQIDSSLTRNQQGSGLGLVITQKLAELHGGWISLTSQKGAGSQFTISLPLRAAI